MPIYEYLCQKCGHKFEKIQKFSDRLIKKCPECGGPVEQTITAPAVQFKGTGWYVTDYANKDGKDRSPAKEKSSSPDGDGGKDKKDTEKGEKKGSKESSSKSESGSKSESNSPESSSKSKESSKKK